MRSPILSTDKLAPWSTPHAPALLIIARPGVSPHIPLMLFSWDLLVTPHAAARLFRTKFWIGWDDHIIIRHIFIICIRPRRWFNLCLCIRYASGIASREELL